MYRNTRGMTLIELMVVVVIIGILAAFAYPSYRAYLDRAKRTEARAALMQIATNEERHYLDQSTYTTDMKELGFADSTITTDSGAYIVSITNADATGFDAQAVWQLGGKEADKCSTFTINESGDKTSAPNPDCWVATR